MRFNAINRWLEGVTQRRKGLVPRRIVPASPVAIRFGIMALDRSLQTSSRAARRLMRRTDAPE